VDNRNENKTIPLSLFCNLLQFSVIFPTPVINAAGTHAPILTVYLGFQSAPIHIMPSVPTAHIPTGPLLNTPIAGVNPAMPAALLHPINTIRRLDLIFQI